MKIVKEFILREIAGECVLVPTGATSQEFNGMITISDTAMDTDVTAITAVMEATTEVMVNTELTVTMARWKKVRRTSLAV